MEWPIARGINGDEKVEIQILAHNRWDTIVKKYQATTKAISFHGHTVHKAPNFYRIFFLQISQQSSRLAGLILSP